MNASSRPVEPTSKWQIIVLLTLAFWFSSSVLLDLVIMPQMYATGMMNQPDFATVGYSIFWVFNRVELVCAALILTGVLVLNRFQNTLFSTKWAIALSLGLLLIGLVYTYLLTPEMSALGLPLDLFATPQELPAEMEQMQQGYWLLELVKLGSVGALLSTIRLMFNSSFNSSTSHRDMV
ncbi:MAG: DUF4149 domain-containing protein [Oculatellaceae cyanobacterium bins.114]|nr:DUF4149 domain-containing protein [Oculatellaceae cyanobacterium bins.114]